MAENEPRMERPWVSRGGGGQGERSRVLRMVLILVLVFVMVATNGFGALPENSFSRSLAEILGQNLPPTVLEPFNEMLGGISQPAIQSRASVTATATETATPTPTATVEALPTETATPSLEASSTSTASATAALTATETPTPTTTGTFAGFPGTVNVSFMYLYFGPAIDHPKVECGPGIYCSYQRGTSLFVVGRNASYGQIWYLVTLPDGKEGWASSTWVLMSGDPAAIPLLAGVPTPPPTPYPTEVPTAVPSDVPTDTGPCGAGFAPIPWGDGGYICVPICAPDYIPPACDGPDCYFCIPGP